ncbi:MAG: hypothetical protein JNM07_02980 [Phycisphaerae bacterium]|nr:hypothetical protein [Phycisphaerae bacterium]
MQPQNPVSAIPPEIEALIPDDPPGWPKVVGIISICWSVLGLTCIGCGVIGMFVPVMMKESMEKAMEGPMPAAMQPSIHQFVQLGSGAAWTVLLMVAGIMCVMRRPAARPLHLLYAVGSFVLAAMSVWFTLQQQQAMNDWAAQNPGTKWADQINQGKSFQWIGLAIGVALSSIWPVFCIVWFGLVKRSAESMHARR